MLQVRPILVKFLPFILNLSSIFLAFAMNFCLLGFLRLSLCLQFCLKIKRKLGISQSVQSLNFGPPCPVWRTLSRGYLYFQQLANFSLETYVNAQRDLTNDIAVEAPREEEQAEPEPRITGTNDIEVEAPRENRQNLSRS